MLTLPGCYLAGQVHPVPGQPERHLGQCLLGDRAAQLLARAFHRLGQHLDRDSPATRWRGVVTERSASFGGPDSGRASRVDHAHEDAAALSAGRRGEGPRSRRVVEAKVLRAGWSSVEAMPHSGTAGRLDFVLALVRVAEW